MKLLINFLGIFGWSKIKPLSRVGFDYGVFIIDDVSIKRGKEWTYYWINGNFVQNIKKDKLLYTW